MPLLFLVGCATTNAPIEQITDDHESQLLSRYAVLFSAPEDIDQKITTTADRNSLINGMIYLINIDYNRRTIDLYDHKAAADFAGDVAITGLGTAATLVGSSGLKTTLAAIITAISGTRASFNSDVLQNQSIIAIISEMDKLRSAQLLEIQQGMNTTSLDKYSTSAALIDLVALYNDGMPVTALQGIISDASVAKSSTDQQMQLIKYDYGADANTAIIRNFWAPSGVVNKTNEAKILAQLKTDGSTDSIVQLLEDKSGASERAKIVKELNLQ